MHNLMIPLVTLPALALWMTARTTHKLLTEAGQWSEELFRGDRLPPLEFPPESFQSSANSEES
jgi:hypothetical protein